MSATLLRKFMSWWLNFFCVRLAYLVAVFFFAREDLLEAAVEELLQAVDLDLGDLSRGVHHEVVVEAGESGLRLAAAGVGEDEGVSEGCELGEDCAFVGAFSVDEQKDRLELLAAMRQNLALLAPGYLRVPDPLLHLHFGQLLEDCVFLERPARVVVVDDALDFGAEDVLQGFAAEREAAAGGFRADREGALAAGEERGLSEGVAFVELSDDFAVFDALDGALGEACVPL